MNDYECPACGETVQVSDTDRKRERVKCPACMSWLSIDTDAEFVNGSWRDLTSLMVVEYSEPT